MNDIEPRVKKLEQDSRSNRESLIEMRRDFHNVSKAVTEMKDALITLVELSERNRANENALLILNKRFAAVEDKLQGVHDTIEENQWVADIGKTVVKTTLTVILVAGLSFIVVKGSGKL